MIFWCKNVTNRHDPFGAERKFFGAEQYFRLKENKKENKRIKENKILLLVLNKIGLV